MDIAVVKEIKAGEGRVALLPQHIKQINPKHSVLVEANAGLLSGASNEDYVQAGATIIDNAKSLYEQAHLIVKVKEILPEEFFYLKENQIVFTNIHSAADPQQLDVLLENNITAIAAEEIHQHGSPNCPLAGEIGALEGLRLTLASHGGTGKHFFAHFGAPSCKAIVLGLGGVGRGALRTLLSLGVEVIGFDDFEGALYKAKLDWPSENFKTEKLDKLKQSLAHADMIVNCVLWDKTRTDHLLTRSMLALLKPTCVIVDISCDPNGAIESCRATSWDDPVYEIDGIRHFCVDNIPGSAPATASQGYGNALLPHVMAIADKGVVEALKQNQWLAKGLTTFKGALTLNETAVVQNRRYTPAEEALNR